MGIVTFKTMITDWLRVKTQTSTPATPSTGYGIFYDKNKTPMFLNSDGTERTLDISPVTETGIDGVVSTIQTVATPYPPSGHYKIFTKSDGLYIVDSAGSVTGPFGASTPPAYPKFVTFWHDQSKVVAGNAIGLSNNSGFNYGVYGSQDPPANGDAFEIGGFVCAAGTYTFGVLYLRRTENGIISISVDGGSAIATIDLYGSNLDNVRAVSTSFALTAGYHRMRVTVSGKNASSSNYRAYIIKMWINQAAY